MNDRDDYRRMLVNLAVGGFCLVVVAAAVVVLLWISGWWPETMIPWLPFERV